MTFSHLLEKSNAKNIDNQKNNSYLATVIRRNLYNPQLDQSSAMAAGHPSLGCVDHTGSLSGY